jgi:aryl sulfotransferase
MEDHAHAFARTLPVKTRNLHNHHFDSATWDDIRFRDDDIVIATYAKSGTTWMQQIVSQLIFDGAETIATAALSPWVDLRVPPREVKLPEIEAQTHRRFLKTHLPVDALVFSPKAKYIYIGRDPRDVMWSLFNHDASANQLWYDTLNKTPGLVGPEIGRPPEDPVTYFRHWLAHDGAPFLDIEPSNWQTALDHCTFDYMKAHAQDCVPLGGAFREGGAPTFLHKGTNGRWRGVLLEADSADLKARMLKELGADCAAWMQAGGKT